VGNFRIEPPGLFRGRGKHPKTGKLKLRVAPESVTINIGKDAKIPDPPPGHTWGKIIHDNTVTWLATWKENVNDSIKYVFLAANSSLKGQSDLKKFEKSRELKQHVDRIRSEYTRDLKDKLMETRQRATAMYLIDRFALRAGNEKDEKNEADTVGCCSLRLEHVTLNPPKQVIFDFLGKDSIRYYNDVEVDEQVWKNLNIFKRKPKTDSDLLFDRLNTTLLNKYLSKQMAGLTAKVFRTYNASHTFQEQLKKGMAELEEECKGREMTIHEKIFKYNKANREVAVLCNHQRTVSKAHENQMTKIIDKIRAFKYQKMKLKQMLFTLNPKLKKRAEYAEEESDIDDEWIIQHEKLLMEKEREKARTKFEKDNEKLIAEKQKPKPEKELNAILQEIDEREKELIEERKSKKIEVKKGTTVEKLKEQISKINEKIDATKLTLKDKDENKQTALSTSKTNYIDPRISFAWCYKYGVPIEKIFNRSLREKFKWALEVDADWVFTASSKQTG
ncbi:146_t:CDS:2, partial [Ambispora leptoticha]